MTRTRPLRLRPLTRRALAPLVPLVATGTLLAGCGDDTARTAADPDTGTPSSAPTDDATSPSAEPTDAGTPTSSAAGGTPSTSAAPTGAPEETDGLAGLLLPAAELPGLRAGWTWTTASTQDETAPTGSCAKTGLVDIGAGEALVRSYTGSEGGATAQEVVAQLADEQSAKRTEAVLRSWRDDCAARLGDGARVTTSGDTYLLQQGTTAEAVALVRSGDRLAVVVVTTEEGTDPRRAVGQAVDLAAARLG